MTRGSQERQRAVMLAITVIAIVVFAVLLIGVVGVLNRYAVGAAVLVIASVWFVKWRRARPAAMAAKDLRRLVALCHDDRAMAERLIAGEERRSPGVSRRVLVLRAIERLRADRVR